jgi:hypothetical protein
MKQLPSQEILKELFSYDQSTGKLTRNTTGKEQKSLYTNGYVRVWIKGYHFTAARVVWKHVNGSEPLEDIDHINGDRLDNRLINLRAVSRAENMRNAKRSAANTSGVTGVVFDKVNNKWMAQIMVDYKMIKIGRYDDINDAIKARIGAEEDHGFHPNHGRV